LVWCEYDEFFSIILENEIQVFQIVSILTVPDQSKTYELLYSSQSVLDINLGEYIDQVISDKTGKIELELKRTGAGAVIEFRGNGIGLPEDSNVKETGSIGIKLVNALASQIEGQIKTKTENGLLYTLEFPIG